MRGFERWFADQGKAEPAPKTAQELPDGVFGEEGAYYAYCCVCNRSYELPIDPIKEGFDQEMSYCGCSPSCCP